MTVSTELYLALLAMDSYNRGYNAGLDLAASGVSATNIGNATLGIKSDVATISPEYAAGFFAQSYTLNGQKIISYRGTDCPSPSQFFPVTKLTQTNVICAT
jgi:hypothetical protein